jgi:hypothetical protein
VSRYGVPGGERVEEDFGRPGKQGSGRSTKRKAEDKISLVVKNEVKRAFSGLSTGGPQPVISLGETGLSSLVTSIVNQARPSNQDEQDEEYEEYEEDERNEPQDEEEQEEEEDGLPERVSAAQAELEGLIRIVNEADMSTEVKVAALTSMVKDSYEGPTGEFLKRAKELSVEGLTVAQWSTQQVTQLAGNAGLASVTKSAEIPGLGKAANVEQGEMACVIDADIGTQDLAPCIAVAVTLHHDGHRYNALCHWDGAHLSASKVIRNLKKSVDEAAAEANPQSARVDFGPARWFAAGGTRSSAHNACALLQAFTSEGVRPDVNFAMSAEEAGHVKSAMLSADGTFSYAGTPGEKDPDDEKYY